MINNKIVQITKLICITAISFSLFGCLTDKNVTIPYNMDFSDDYEPLTIDLDDKTEFKILQIADTQFDTSTDVYLNKTFDMLTKVINHSSPNLIVLTGDNTALFSGKRILEKFIPFLDSFEIPYAAVFGNHDAEGGPRTILAQYYLDGKNSLFQKGPTSIHGVGNYQINLIQNENLKYSFYMIDSNRYRQYSAKQRIESVFGGKTYDYIYPDQIAWYAYSVNETKRVNNNKIVPSLAFFHIPLPEFRAYKDASEENIIIPQYKNGEEVCNPVVNTGLFNVMKELGSTKAVFVGHDHINNYVFNYQNVILGYGLKSGETSYYDKELQGGTLITLKNDFKDIDVKHVYVSEID